MGFRDDLEAARARIDTLDRELAELRRQKRTSKDETPPFATLAVVLFVTVIGLGVGVAYEWHRAEEALSTAAEWRQMEGETAVALEETRHRLREVQQRRTARLTADPARDPIRQSGWGADGDERVDSWSVVVRERIGPAPASLGQRCFARFEQLPGPTPPHSWHSCALHVTCGELSIYPRPGETADVHCGLARDGAMRSMGSAVEGATRALGTPSALRIDDGATGTWSLLFEPG